MSSSLYWHWFLHVNICNLGHTDGLLNVPICWQSQQSRCTLENELSFRFGLCWRLVSRLNNNELSSTDSVLLKDTLETNVSSQREWTGGLLAMGCAHAVSSAVSSCIQSGCTPRPRVARQNTVIWTNGQLETGTACFESTSYENMVKNDTRCYGAHLFSRDNGIKGYQRSSRHQDGETGCYSQNLMFTKDTIQIVNSLKAIVIVFNAFTWPAYVKLHYSIETI